jgi:hypothetical protein
MANMCSCTLSCPSIAEESGQHEVPARRDRPYSTEGKGRLGW